MSVFQASGARQVRLAIAGAWQVVGDIGATGDAVWSHEATNKAAELAAELGYHHVFSPSKDFGETNPDNYYEKGVGFGKPVRLAYRASISDQLCTKG